MWTTTLNMNYTRDRHSETVLSNGKVLVPGGQNSGGSFNNTELYDPMTGIWTITNSMNYARAAHTTSKLANGKVLAVGGVNGGVYLNRSELYQP